MRAVLLLVAAAAAEKRSWFGSSQKKEKPVTREGRAVQLARKVLVKAEWPVTIRTEYGIGYSVSWPAGWKMPER